MASRLERLVSVNEEMNHGRVDERGFGQVHDESRATCQSLVDRRRKLVGCREIVVAEQLEHRDAHGTQIDADLRLIHVPPPLLDVTTCYASDTSNAIN